MNCAYHAGKHATVNCQGCGKYLCPACDHRIKGFPYCQDCIVSGVELLQRQANLPIVPVVKRQSSPFAATFLSLVCPGLGAAYNGQTIKALTYFGVFVSLFQMAVMTKFALFVFGFMAMWLYAAVDAWRTAQLIRVGISPNGAEDLIVKRLSGNPMIWGIVLAVLGVTFFLYTFWGMKLPLKQLLPVALVGLGAYLLHKVWRERKERKEKEFAPDYYGWADSADKSYKSYDSNAFRPGGAVPTQEIFEQKRTGSWK
jgi:hypothetical protein